MADFQKMMDTKKRQARIEDSVADPAIASMLNYVEQHRDAPKNRRAARAIDTAAKRYRESQTPEAADQLQKVAQSFGIHTEIETGSGEPRTYSNIYLPRESLTVKRQRQERRKTKRSEE